MDKPENQDEMKKLIEATRRGDERAFGELLRRYQHLALACAVTLLKDFHLAQDVVQEAFLIVYYRLHTLKDIEAFPAWLRGIVRHRCFRILRRRDIRETLPDGLRPPVSADDAPDHLIESKERRKLVLAEIDKLPPEQREIVFMFYIEEHTQQEVAQFLGMSQSTVNNRLYAARQILKRRMFEMVKHTLADNQLPDDFAENTAKIVRAQGPVIEAKIASGAAVSLFDGWILGGRKPPGEAQLTVIQRDINGRIRLIDTGGSGSIKPGTPITETGEDHPLPVNDKLLAEAVKAVAPRRAKEQKTIETGIKIIDLFSPLPERGTVGLFGIQGVGRAIVVMELYHRLRQCKGRLAVLYFVSNSEAANLKTMIEREPNFPPDADGPLETAWLVTNRATDPDYAGTNEALDARLFFSPLISCRDLYPAVDGLLSASRLLQSDIIENDHVETARRAAEMLSEARQITYDRRFCEYVAIGAYAGARQRHAEQSGHVMKNLTPKDNVVVSRGRKLELFLTQPFYTTESYTNMPGVSVPRHDTISGCRAILDGDADELPEQAFAFTGTLDDVKSKTGRKS